MNSEEIKIEDYVFHFLEEMENLYSFKDKTVVFLFLNPDINNAKTLLNTFGAEKVYYINPDFKETQTAENGRIVLTCADDDGFGFIDDKTVDLVIGLEILEHINNIDKFFREIKRILKDSGSADLQGCPMWTCYNGHHLWLDKYNFSDETNPFEPWEHLVYRSEEEMKKALSDKKIPENDCEEIVNWIYNPEEISRHSPTEIIEAALEVPLNSEEAKKINLTAFNIIQYTSDDFEYFIKNNFYKISPNSFYEKASQFYSEDDLQTSKLTIKIKALKNINLLKSGEAEENSSEELEDWMLDFLKTFNENHPVENKKVLNLTTFNFRPVADTFYKMGASDVVNLTPWNITEGVADDVIYEEYFDIVFGIDSLIFLENPDKFFANLKKLTKEETVFYFNGYMPYTYGRGHRICEDGFDFNTETNPLPLWSHLVTDDEKELVRLLKQNNMPETLAVKTSQDFLSEYNSLLKMSPSELFEIASKYINVYLRRIFKYHPKNEYYEKALEKYSSDDLNTYKYILSSDIPTTNWLDELDINHYLMENLSDINAKYNFKDKKVLNVTPHINKEISLAIEAFQAAEVVSFYGYDNGFELNGGKNIKCICQDLEDLENIDGKYDIIYGLDVLEHVKNVKKFFVNLKNLVKDNGLIFLQGSPLWPSDNGHNFLMPLECGMLKTGEGSPCLEPWEHLAYSSKEELKAAMLKKNFTENDAEKVSEFIFNSDDINRLSYAKFIEILNEIDDVYYGSKKILHYSEENEFYQKANEKYTHEELRTKELKLFIRKKLS